LLAALLGVDTQIDDGNKSEARADLQEMGTQVAKVLLSYSLALC